MGGQKKEVWVKDPALAKTDVYRKGTVESETPDTVSWLITCMLLFIFESLVLPLDAGHSDF